MTDCDRAAIGTNKQKQAELYFLKPPTLLFTPLSWRMKDCTAGENKKKHVCSAGGQVTVAAGAGGRGQGGSVSLTSGAGGPGLASGAVRVGSGRVGSAEALGRAGPAL